MRRVVVRELEVQRALEGRLELVALVEWPELAVGRPVLVVLVGLRALAVLEVLEAQVAA